MKYYRIPAVVGIAFFLGVCFVHSAQATRQQTLRPGEYSIKSFGAKGDGYTTDTVAIQAAISAANKAGGGTVEFPPGVYVTGTLRLLSNVTLEIEAGAVVIGSSRLADYGSIEEYGFGRHYGVDYTGEGTRVGLVVAEKADSVAIVGGGVIDGNSNAFFDFTKPHYSLDFDPQYTRQGSKFMEAVLATGDGPVAFLPTGRAGTAIVFSHCKNVLVRDITVRNTPNWTIHLSNVEGAVVDGIHILNDLRIPNSDGIDCFGCRNVHFSNCEIRTGDDDFAIVGSDDVTVTNCSLTSNSSGIRVEDTRTSVFNNLTIHANRGIGVYDRGQGTTAELLFSDIVIETHLLTGHWWGKGEPVYIVIGTAGGNAGTITGIRFSNISATAENGIVLYGNPSATIRRVSFDHFWLRLRTTRKEVNEAVGGNFDMRWTAADLKTAIFSHDIPGMYGRYVEELSLSGFQVEWADQMPTFYSSALQFEDVQDLMIDRFRGRQASPLSPSGVISLSRISDVSIRDSKADDGATTFLLTNQVTGRRLLSGNDLSRAHAVSSENAGFLETGDVLPSE